MNKTKTIQLIFPWLLVLGGVCLAGQATAQTCVPPPEGMVSWWPGDGDATDIQDGNDGTVQNGAIFAPGKVGQAFDFDGIDDLVEVPDALNLDTSFDQLTIDAWFFPRVIPLHAAGVSKWREGSIAGDASYQLNFLNGKAYLLIKVAGKSYVEVFNVGPDIPVNAWTHVAMVWEGQNGTLKAYFDGNVTVSASHPRLVGVIDDSPHPVGIGGNAVFSSFYFDGLIDEVEIFDRALTQPEIQAIFNAGSAGKCKGLDSDGDGVVDDDDFCPGTAIPEGVPTVRLRPNRWALTDGDTTFDTVIKGNGKGPNRSYMIEDTAGCSCEQIIAAQGLGLGHTYHGCSISAMDDWIALVTP